MSFARHQTFYIRAGWFAKAIDELDKNHKLFSEKNAPVKLGIGKNMTQALRFWVKASGLVESKSPSGSTLLLSQFGELVRKYDPYLELDLTWWLVHYHLVSNPSEAESWYYLFNQYPRTDVDRMTFIEAIERHDQNSVSRSSYQKDYDCIISTYLGTGDTTQTPEDNTICPLTRLGLLTSLKSGAVRKVPPEKPLPTEVLFLVIKQAGNDYQQISGLETDARNIGKVFNLSVDMIYRHLDAMQERRLLSFSRTAGIDTVHVSDVNPWDVIRQAYEELSAVGGDTHEAQ